jgi:hypothetical protein
VQAFNGSGFESRSAHVMTRLVDKSHRHGIRALAVTAVGRRACCRDRVEAAVIPTVSAVADDSLEPQEAFGQYQRGRQ